MTPGILSYQDLAGNSLANSALLAPINGKWYVIVYGTGFGLANPSVAGQPASANPLSVLTASPSVNFTDSEEKLSLQSVIWAGLAPGQIGVDQINVQLSGAIAPGAGTLTVVAPDGHTVRVPINLSSQ